MSAAGIGPPQQASIYISSMSAAAIPATAADGESIIPASCSMKRTNDAEQLLPATRPLFGDAVRDRGIVKQGQPSLKAASRYEREMGHASRRKRQRCRQYRHAVRRDQALSEAAKAPASPVADEDRLLYGRLAAISCRRRHAD